MSVGVEYPNEGAYEGGKPRYTQRDRKGVVTYCREATDDEVRKFAVVDALDRNTDAMNQLSQHLNNLATYGVSVNK